MRINSLHQLLIYLTKELLCRLAEYNVGLLNHFERAFIACSMNVS